MRFKLGLVIGGIVGYVLGARAGRKRYEQIKTFAARARQHPAVAQLTDQSGGLLEVARYTVAASLTIGAKLLRAAESRSG